MQASIASERRVLVLATRAETATTLWRRVAESGLEVRATTGYEEFVRLLRTWQPTHVAVCVDPDDPAVGTETGAEPRAGPWVTVIPSDGLEETLLTSIDSSTAATIAPDPTAGTLGELDDALDLGHLSVVYQPKIDIRSGAPFALETLARWHRPGRPSVPPDDFVRLAEISGRIHRLTETVFTKALTWFGRHLAATEIELCLNLSARSLVDPDLPGRVERSCRDVGVPPDRLVVEVTETSVSEDQTTAHEVLTRLGERGIRIALDDFGAGHASLLQLARHPFTDLKVDRGLVAGATTSTESRTILTAILALGSNLGLRVTAEGVEDEATERLLTELGFHFMQGHHLARPMDGPALLRWLASSNGASPRF
jgi:EAL domain-containing protein (putative c-di-GMP-specific phosphodiesterase class I)